MVRSVGLGLLAGLFLVGLGLATGRATARPVTAEAGCWMPVPGPALAQNNFLTAITAFAADNIWTVGYTQDNAGHQPALVLHWDGQAWQPVSVPLLPPGAELTAVGGLGPDDFWIVGRNYGHTPDNKEFSLPLMLHRKNGTWDDPPYVPSGNYERLSGVAALAPDNVWAVGGALPNDGSNRPVLLHWNGQNWKYAASPAPAPGGPRIDYLDGAAPAGDSTAWGVGGPGILRGTGDGWGIAATVPLTSTGLAAVAASGPHDAWAVGSYNPLDLQSQNDRARATLTMHWNGTAWSLVPSPNAGYGSYLTAVAAAASDDAWAAGYNESGDRHFPVAQPIVEHWDGAAWSLVPGLVQAYSARITAAAVAPNGDLWLVALTQT
ncbi:MAG TPA: hypothetical protein VKY74_26415, partial [Chloroflexia bacterium]|nr:hypothetical protein [Chloroflexia bacterium]